MDLHNAGFFIVLLASTFNAKEINKENCIDEKEISSKCSFEIRIKPPLNKSLECKLKFNDPSNQMRLSNIKFMVKAQEDTKCPLIALDIYEGNKPYRMFASCGGSHDPFNMTFFNVSLTNVSYHNQELFDQETNLEMNLSLSDRKFCDEPLAVVAWNKLHWIWIIAVVLVIGIVVSIMRCKRKGCFKKKSHGQSTENHFEIHSSAGLFQKIKDKKTEAENSAYSVSGKREHLLVFQ